MRKVQNLEQRIAEFKDKYSDSLPELLEYNLSTVERLQTELASNESQIISLKDQIIALTIEQSNLQYYIPEAAVGTTTGTSAEVQLRQAQSEYSKLQAKYSPNHPDVMQLKRQIDSLKSELGIQGDDSTEVQAQLNNAENELAALKQRYADTHPDVKALSKRVASLKQKLKNSSKPTRSSGSSTASGRNPVYSRIKGRISSIEREIVRLNERQEDIKLQLAEYENRIVQTHQVQRAYTDLTRDYENNAAKYRELKAKQLEAELGQNLEAENKGESFTLIEPPVIPSKSEKPNRKKILAFGVVASIGMGLGLALLIDMLKGGIRGYNAITRVVGQAPLVVIPIIATQQDMKRKATGRKRLVFIGILLFILSVLGFHFFIMNLEIFWFKLMRKISLL